MVQKNTPNFSYFSESYTMSVSSITKQFQRNTHRNLVFFTPKPATVFPHHKNLQFHLFHPTFTAEPVIPILRFSQPAFKKKPSFQEDLNCSKKPSQPPLIKFQLPETIISIYQFITTDLQWESLLTSAKYCPVQG